jgi:hypothetical protein
MGPNGFGQLGKSGLEAVLSVRQEGAQEAMAASNQVTAQVLVDPEPLKAVGQPAIDTYARDLMRKIIRYVCAVSHEIEA